MRQQPGRVSVPPAETLLLLVFGPSVRPDPETPAPKRRDLVEIDQQQHKFQ